MKRGEKALGCKYGRKKNTEEKTGQKGCRAWGRFRRLVTARAENQPGKKKPDL